MGNCIQRNKEVTLVSEDMSDESQKIDKDDVCNVIEPSNLPQPSSSSSPSSSGSSDEHNSCQHSHPLPTPKNLRPHETISHHDHYTNRNNKQYSNVTLPLPKPEKITASTKLNMNPNSYSSTLATPEASQPSSFLSSSSASSTSTTCILPLPEPEKVTASAKFDMNPNSSSSTLATPEASQSSSSSSSSAPSASTTCVLPLPITESEILSSPFLKAFPFQELEKATSNYCENSLLGEGGFGCVYKGWIDEDTLTATKPGFGVAVAIKKLIPYGFQGHNEWLSEVNYLGRLRHPNLVKLVGYCSRGEDRILVYEFMPGGSMENHLFKRNAPPLAWATRIKVAAGAARGLCFLHESKSPVIYRDFKTSNILLDSEFNAKLSDFGLAKTGPTESQTHVTTRVMGTEGYCDPRYLTTGRLTVKCDVYSFGVVLLELLTGRRAIDETKCEEEKNLVNWVRLHVHDNGRRIFRIMDTKLEGQYCKRSAFIAANIALRCVHHEPKYRPPMTYILEILDNLPSQRNLHKV